MAETLLGNLLGQSSNSTSSGLLGGPSIFQTQPSRGQRRSALLSQAISSQGSNPYARLGAAFGGLIGMGGRAAGESLGVLQEPEQVRQSRLIREAQQAAAESGIDPVSEPERFLEVIDPIVEGDPLLRSGIRAQIVRLQRELASEQPELSNVRDIETEDGTVTVGTLNNRLVEVTPEGPKPFSGERVQETKGDAVNVRLPDGSFVRGRELEDGTVVDLQGREFPATANVVGLDLAASKESDLPQKDVDILNSKEIGVKNYIDLANEAIGVYNQNPSANTLAAEGTRILSGIQSEFDALLDVTGVELADGTSASKILDPSTYESRFQKLGLENAGLKSLYLSLALSQAQAEAEQKGRALSDKDVDRFLRTQGAQYANPKIATELLRRNASRLQNAFVNEYETRTGEDFDGEFDDLLEFAPPEEDAAEQKTEEVETVNWDDL